MLTRDKPCEGRPLASAVTRASAVAWAWSGDAPAWISAANEVAVDAFLEGQIAWRDIAAVIAATLDRHDGAPATDAAAVIDADLQARRSALEELNSFASVVR
jgi:1-deoxy-D-xylulose 5-phosphate reductoisomerase